MPENNNIARETAFLFQRLSIAVQKFKEAVKIQEIFDLSDGQPDLYSLSSIFICFKLCF